MPTKIKQYRNYFNNFKRILEYKELQRYLLNKQLGLCINCKKPISLNKDTHLFHCISLFDLVILNRKDLATNYNNYYLSCNRCNWKQSKNSNFNILKEDVLTLLSIKEVAKLIYIRHYNINLRKLMSFTNFTKHS